MKLGLASRSPRTCDSPRQRRFWSADCDDLLRTLIARTTKTAAGQLTRTVGAALTETGTFISSSSEPVDLVELTVDRPFVMRVLDTRTGWTLFVAIVNDPTDVPD